MDETALRQLAGKVGDLGVVFLPLGDMLGACEFGLFLLGARCRSEHVLMKNWMLTVSGFWQRSIVLARCSLSPLPVGCVNLYEYEASEH